MSSRPQPAPRVIDFGTPPWCWSQLGSGGEGILSYDAPRGRRSLAVPYTVTGGDVTIALEEFNEAGWSAAGTEASLEVSGFSSGDLRWVVRVIGTAARGPRAGTLELDQSRHLHPANGLSSADVADRLSMLTPRIRGFYETSLGDHRP